MKKSERVKRARMGGLAAAKSMTKQERRERAIKAITTRWARKRAA